MSQSHLRDSLRNAKGALFLIVCLVLFTTSIHAQDATTQTLKAAIEAPGTAGLTVTVFDAPFTSVENDRRAGVTVAANKDGVFEVSWPATDATQLEITGPRVRRARFPWPFAQLSKSADLPVFRLSAGTFLAGKILSAADRKGIQDALVGPVIPGPDAPPDSYNKTFPFFTSSGEGGSVELTGIYPGISYDIQVAAKGYQRRRVQLLPGEPFEVELEPGGVDVRLRALFEDTMKPAPRAIVEIISEENQLRVERRADEEGRVTFTGMPAGNYMIAAREDGQDMMRRQEFVVAKETSDREWPVLVIPGINVSGIVADAETGRPVPDAYLALGNQSLRTGANGTFEFRNVRGPWPRTFEFAHPDYNLSAEDQDSSLYPINGWDAYHIRDLVVAVRRERFLEVLATAGENGIPRSILELHDLPASPAGTPRRDSITTNYTLLPLEGAGRRLAWLRGSEVTSELVPLQTAVDQTTTTLIAELLPGARLKGSLTYHEEGVPPPTFEVAVDAVLSDLPEPLRILKARPDAAGAFDLAALPPGSFIISFLRPEGGEPYYQQEVMLTRSETVEVHHKMHKGMTVQGLVVNEEDVPLREILVHVYGQSPEGGSLHLSQLTDGEGRFNLDGYGGEKLDQILAQNFSYEEERQEDIPLPAEDLRIVLREKGGLLIKIAAPPEELPGAQAYIIAANRNQAPNGELQWMGYVDSAESFAGEDSVRVTPRSQGRLRAAVQASGEWDVSSPFEWHGQDGLEFTLRPGATASLTATLEGWTAVEGEPPPELFLINTTLPEGQTQVEFAPVFVRPNRFEFAAVPPGDYILLASTADGRTATRTGIELESGARASATISLQGTASFPFSGTVVLDDDKQSPAYPAGLVVFFADIPEAEPLDTQQTSRDGSFKFPALIPGRPYLLRVTFQDETQQFSLGVMNGQTPPRTIVLTQAADVEVVLPARLARAAAGKKIPFQLVSAEGNGAVMFAAEEGTSRQRLRPGNYNAYWGEQSLGELRIEKGAERILLPELP